jgi:hypothetical protein
VHVQQQKKHYVKKFFFDFDCYLADPYFEDLHDPTDEPSAEPLIDEHQDATYPITKWKCN